MQDTARAAGFTPTEIDDLVKRESFFAQGSFSQELGQRILCSRIKALDKMNFHGQAAEGPGSVNQSSSSAQWEESGDAMALDLFMEAHRAMDRQLPDPRENSLRRWLDQPPSSCLYPPEAGPVDPAGLLVADPGQAYAFGMGDAVGGSAAGKDHHGDSSPPTDSIDADGFVLLGHKEKKGPNDISVWSGGSWIRSTRAGNEQKGRGPSKLSRPKLSRPKLSRSKISRSKISRSKLSRSRASQATAGAKSVLAIAAILNN
ncbi:hypothetical protein F4777DRAFT_231983 [Nemania sp. FL0916]|nr:hypothetical protein F4777DRAFT_231983 [Nemania sp. FL0916]